MEPQKILIQEEQDKNKMRSPFLSIWFQPRRTIRHLLNTTTHKYDLPLAMSHGVFFMISWANKELLGNMFQFCLWGFILLFVAIGVIIGPIRMYIFSFLFQWIGSLFGGKGSQQEIRTVFAWSSVPLFMGLFIWLYLILHQGHYLFGYTTPYMRTIMHLDMQALYMFLIILGIWRIVLMISNLAEVHQLTIIKSITIIIPLLYADMLLTILIINASWSIHDFIASFQI